MVITKNQKDLKPVLMEPEVSGVKNPYYIIREDSKVGDRCIIGRNVMIEEAVKIGNFVKIMTSSYITGFTTIRDHVFIAPCVSMANDNTLDREKIPCLGPTIQKSARIPDLKV